ncbi:site-2 protease family protein [Candidatus Micrarchaeota archaeon]|nr:site-2 protease family protein [Candidatus Micrarchaeota archaeon]
MRFNEALHIGISVLTITLAFWFLWSGVRIGEMPNALDPLLFAIVFLTIGLGFILHELAHRFVAMRYGAHAEYRAWTLGLFLAIVLAVTVGFIFAAPGAVYIFGRVNRKQNAMISLAGPVTNLVLAGVFIALSPFLGAVSAIGAQVNLWLGLFNMIPFFPFDGQKVAAWDWRIWLAVFLVFILFFFSLSFLPTPTI